MKYGVCTWTFGRQSLANTAAVLSELGYDGVELLGDLSLYNAQEAQTILDDAGLSVFSLTSTDTDNSHPDEGIRQAGVDYYYRLSRGWLWAHQFCRTVSSSFRNRLQQSCHCGVYCIRSKSLYT